jgi:hypothetical protein
VLTSRAIPQHQDDDADWHRFLVKAAKGSTKAVEMLTAAEMAYMAALTEDPRAPETLAMPAYRAAFCAAFPRAGPESVQSIIEVGVRAGWFPRGVVVVDHRLHDDEHYRALWAKGICVDSRALVHDAVVTVLNSWASATAFACIEDSDRSGDYDSRLVTSAMLFLALTWPGGRSVGASIG